MSTPPGPKAQGAPPNDAASRPSLDQTFLGVAPAPRAPVDVVAPRAPAPAPAAPPSAPPPTPARNAIVAAPVIAVSPVIPVSAGGSGSASPAPITPRVAAQPLVSPERAVPAAVEGSGSAAASEQTLMHPTPHAAGAPASPPPARSPFPKPEPYAVPPRAGDAARLGGADRTALSSDYLRAAREAALGRGGNLSEARRNEPQGKVPASSQERVLGSRAAFATTPVIPTPSGARRDEAPPSFRTQQSIGSEPPPRAPVQAAAAHRAPAFGTMLEAPRGGAPLPALPELPQIPPSERSPAAGSPRFEPVPAARTHLSERGATALSGQSLAHISVDWSPELAEQVRKAGAPAKSRTARWLLLVAGALVLVVLGFVTLGGPLRRVVARVAGRALTTEVERAAETTAAPSVTTLSNQPAAEPAPAGNAEPVGDPPRPAP